MGRAETSPARRQRWSAHYPQAVGKEEMGGVDHFRALDVDVVLVRRRGGGGVVGKDDAGDAARLDEDSLVDEFRALLDQHRASSHGVESLGPPRTRVVSSSDQTDRPSIDRRRRYRNPVFQVHIDLPQISPL